LALTATGAYVRERTGLTSRIHDVGREAGNFLVTYRVVRQFLAVSQPRFLRAHDDFGRTSIEPPAPVEED
jgi:hypothetical protein